MDTLLTRATSWFRHRFVRPLIGEPAALPERLAERWPELTTVRWRRGGLPPRVGGWCLGQSSVQGITLWRTVYLAPGVAWEPALLLHEHRHAEQFAGSLAFPLLYVWESLTRGYAGNRFEADADAWAATRYKRPWPSNLPPGA
ncbi:MAG: hypothetical protein IT355_07320 [Gemmatimonadaceae bacterium]|nr:hypothetical protein [Gemmatimonadaceae bacterium]